MSSITSHPVASIHGTAAIPGDKSISHRALMLASQVLGETHIYGLLEGEDVQRTAQALRMLGVSIESLGEYWRVHGVGVHGLQAPETLLDMGNSGTSTRLLMGLLTPYAYTCFFTGDASLNQRPMRRVMEPLAEMGARFTAREGGKLPLALVGTTQTLPITYRLPVASAQVKSAVLLAGLATQGVTTVIEPHPTRDHTENMLEGLGFTLTRTPHEDGVHVALRGLQHPPRAQRSIHVPADPSSAAFAIVATLIAPQGDVTLRNLCLNPLRCGLLTTLKEMGATITLSQERKVAGEWVGDVHVVASRLRGVRVPASRAPAMIDEYPILAVAAAYAEGETVMEGLEELRVKESDRLMAIVEGLTACGVDARVTGDVLTVRGGNTRGDAHIRTHMDHRIAMSFLVFGIAATHPVTVDDAHAIGTSFPGFVALMNSLGARLTSVSPTRRLVIAIDGPAASGKGTLARRLADHLGLRYLDTGSLYRATALKLVEHNKDPHTVAHAIEAAQSIDVDDLANPHLRQEHVGQVASIVSAMPEVRAILLEFQRKVARSGSGAVLDGRDIGTVVCPDADYKFFLTADLRARAHRRHKELTGQGIEVVFESVHADLKERDERDAARPIAPLKPAPDAIVIDTSTMDASSVFERLKVTLR